jgi:glycosyltransferase involved in cell wall biosynthesis
MQEEIDKVLTEHHYDLVQVEFSHMGSYRLTTGAFTVLDAHNVEYENFRRMWQNNRSLLKRLHYYVEHRKFYREEIEACERFDAVFVTSGRDKEILDADTPAVPKYVVPNGVDTSYFTPAPSAPEPHSLVFTGAMSYLPNHDGMHYFLDEVFPLIEREIPDVKITIVGSNPPEELRRRARSNIIVTGFVEDVRPYVWRAGVYVVPLRMGSGTRLKILEALAMNMPVVTTSIGTEGIRVEHNMSALIADTPSAFAASVIRLLRDAALRSSLAAAGKTLVHREYDWNVIGNQLELYYRQFRPEASLAERLVNRPMEVR